MDRSSFFFSFCCIVPRQLLDSFICRRLFSRHLSRHLARYLSTPLFVENYWTLLNRFQRDPILIFLISTPIHLPNTLFSLKTFNPHDFQPFFASNHLVWSLFLSLFMHFMHLDLGFGIFKKFWGFSKLLSVYWNFGMGFCLNDLWTSCIASHMHYNYIFMHLDVCYIC